MDKKTQSTATVIFTDNPPFNQEGKVENKDAKPGADSLYGGNPAVMADAVEQMKNVRKLLKDRLKSTKDNAETFIDINATEKVRLQGSKEIKGPSLKPYTEAVDVKDRAELSQLVEKAKKEKKLFKIGRSMKEGFRYTFLIEGMVKEEAKPEFKVGSTIKIINMAGEPGYTGKVGKITNIDDAGQLHGTWGGLALIPGDDKFELVTVINHDTGKIEEKKHDKEHKEEVEEAFFFDGKEFGTKLTSFEQAKELGKGTKWPVSADEKYFDMYHDKGFELFVKGTGKDRIITIVRNGDVVNAYDINDKLVVLEKVMPTMKAMPKMEGAPEEHHHEEEHKDEGEYDEEGDMAKSDLQIMADAALELHGMLADEENLPEWVQAKITLATDYIDTARDYMKAKKDGLEFPEPKENEEVELEPLEESVDAWGKEIISLQDFATAVEKLGRDDIDVFPILKGIAAGTHRAFVKHEGKDTTITVLRGDVVEMTLTSKPTVEGMDYKEALIEPKKGKKESLNPSLKEPINYDIYDLKVFPGKDGNKKAQEWVDEHDWIEEHNIMWDAKRNAFILIYKTDEGLTWSSQKEIADEEQKQKELKKEEMEPRDSKFFPGEDGDTEAHIFIEDKGIEDFDLMWDDKKGGYVLTWESKEEMEEMKEYVTEEKHGKEEKKDLKESFDYDGFCPQCASEFSLSDLKQGKKNKNLERCPECGHEAPYEVFINSDFEEQENQDIDESKHKKHHKEKLKEDTTILSSLNEFEPWSGAVSTWELIVEADKVDALDFMLEDLYPEGITSTELNDLLWFESDWVLDMLGIDESEVEAEDEDGEEAEEEPKAEAKPERELIALDDLDEEPVVLDIDELEEGKHAHSKKEAKMGSGNIVKEVQDFVKKIAGK
jgi:hypothetical protein